MGEDKITSQRKGDTTSYRVANNATNAVRRWYIEKSISDHGARGAQIEQLNKLK